MNVLLIGSGGRESAFAWKLSQSSRLAKLFIAPGNAGTSQYGTNVNVKETDFEGIKKIVLENHIELVIVGPEAPLVAGIKNYFSEDDKLMYVPVIGPDKTGAQLEGSKDFSKAFMLRNGVPTAAAKTFTEKTVEEGVEFLKSIKPPFVLKADGLAAGKGVIITDDIREAEKELRGMLEWGKFGEAGRKVLIEEFLKGIELSVFVLTDGQSYLILPEAKDYKRIGEKDTGLNTGGMGAVSPVPFASADFMRKVEQRVVIPTIEGLKKENIDYSGFIFIGLMNVNGEPLVIEYNCRMGDPETEVVLPRIENDLLELFIKAGTKHLHEESIKISDKTAMTVMAVSGGYPEDFEKGFEITGAENVKDGIVFYAGANNKDSKVVSSGGRVFALTCLGNDLKEARKKCFTELPKVKFDKMYYRKDIGEDLIGWN